MDKYWTTVGDRFSGKQRDKLLKEKNIYTYDIRDGDPDLIEFNVWVNHIGTLLTNFPVLSEENPVETMDGDWLNDSRENYDFFESALKEIRELDEAVTSFSNVDKDHDLDEYLELFGEEYNNGDLKAYVDADFEEKVTPYRWDIVYWLIDGIYYETDIPYKTEKIHEDKEPIGFEYIIFEIDYPYTIVDKRDNKIDAEYCLNKWLHSNLYNFDDLAIYRVKKDKFKKGDHYIEDDEDILDEAKKKIKKRKHKKYHLNPNAGNPARNRAIFNHMMGTDYEGEFDSEGIDSGDVASEGTGMGESLEDEKKPSSGRTMKREFKIKDKRGE